MYKRQANTRAILTAPFTASGVTLTVNDNKDIGYVSGKGDYLLLGEMGDPKSEECYVNSAVTHGTSITIATGTLFSHEIHTPVTKIYERQIKIYGSSSSTAAGTLMDTINIRWGDFITEYTIPSTGTAYAYYYAAFYDGTTVGASSDYVAATGVSPLSASFIIASALLKAHGDVDGDLITNEWLLELLNDYQDEVTTYLYQDETGRRVIKDWSFEMFDDEISLAIAQNENKYAITGLANDLKYGNTNQSIIGIRMGSQPLQQIDIKDFDDIMKDTTRANVATATIAGDTSIVLDDTYEFADSGNLYIGSDICTYTGNAKSTATLTGIPSSGTGSISGVHAIGSAVWQGITPGMPEKYVIHDGYLMLDVPPDANWVGYKLKVRAFKKLARITSMSDVIEVPFPLLAKTYVGAHIEFRKGNTEDGSRMYGVFQNILAQMAGIDRTPVNDTYDYYNFGDV